MVGAYGAVPVETHDHSQVANGLLTCDRKAVSLEITPLEYLGHMFFYNNSIEKVVCALRNLDLR